MRKILKLWGWLSMDAHLDAIALRTFDMSAQIFWQKCAFVFQSGMRCGRGVAWKSGIISLQDVYRETWSPEWGKGFGIRPLSEFLDEETLRSFRGLGSEYYRLISTKVNASESAYALAEGLLERYREAEPELTALLKVLVEGEGGTMAGLEFRLKSVDSLARKITSEATKEGLSEHIVARSIMDTSRYTAIIDSSSLTSSAKEIERLVTAQGWELHKIKNYFGTGGTYQGLHYNFQKGELFFEIKFHTQESFNIKMANHYDYEVSRTDSISEDLKRITEKWMRLKWEEFIPPKLYFSITNYP